MNLKRVFVVLAVGSAAIGVAHAQGNPVRVGASLDLSGPAGDVGREVLDGAQYAVSKINESGGVLGRQIEFRYQDNGTNPQKAVDQALVIVKEGVDFLISPQSSAGAIAVSKQVSGPSKIPMCVGTSNSNDITVKEFQPYIFAIAPSAYMEGKGVAQYLGKESYKRYAIIAPNYAGGRANAESFKQHIRLVNPSAEIVVEEYPKFGATDFTASINKVLAAKPDYVWTVLFASDLITFTKQAQSVGFFSTIGGRFIALYDSNTLATLGKDVAVGTDGWQRAPTNVIFERSAEGKAFVEGYRARFGRYPSDWATLTYECMAVWAQAAKAAGTVEAGAVMAAVESKEFSILRGPVRFGKFDHQAEVPVYVGKIAPSAQFAQPVMDLARAVPGSEARPSEETVLQLRKQ